MSYRSFLREYRRAYQHKGGLKALALGQLELDWFKKLQDEMLWVIKSQQSSDVTDPTHTTNWTRPIGTARQFSLFNASGKCSDYLGDFVPPGQVGKKLVFPQLSATTRFAKLFDAELWNLRLNGLGKASQLSLHEEDPISPTPSGVSYKVRFHLPIFTSPRAEMLIDGESFHFAEGELYFFHHGCVHAAVNRDENPRYHIVLDCLLTRAFHSRLFPGENSLTDSGFHRFTPEEAQARTVGRPSPVQHFVTECGQTKSILDYGRTIPTALSWYRTMYPSAFRPFDRIIGTTH